MLEIAGGIILAVLFFVFLREIIVLALGAVAISIIGGAAYFLFNFSEALFWSAIVILVFMAAAYVDKLTARANFNKL